MYQFHASVTAQMRALPNARPCPCKRRQLYFIVKDRASCHYWRTHHGDAGAAFVCGEHQLTELDSKCTYVTKALE